MINDMEICAPKVIFFFITILSLINRSSSFVFPGGRDGWTGCHMFTIYGRGTEGRDAYTLLDNNNMRDKMRNVEMN